MTLVYHGTELNIGIQIARDEAILSNLEQRIEFFKQLYREQINRSFEKEHPGKTIEQVALAMESTMYAEHEIDTRVKCLSVAKDIMLSKSYATQYDKHNGGLILGIELDKNLIKDKIYQSMNPDILFISKRLSIKNLKEIYLTPTARKHEMQIREAFNKYNPSYFLIK